MNICPVLSRTVTWSYLLNKGSTLQTSPSRAEVAIATGHAHSLVGFTQALTEVGRRKRKSRLWLSVRKARRVGEGSELGTRSPSSSCEAGLGFGGGSGIEGVNLAAYRLKGVGINGGGSKHLGVKWRIFLLMSCEGTWGL